MATSIEREFVFLAGIHFEEKFMMNAYSIVLAMDVMTDSIREQNIAMDRIKCFLQEILTNTVMIQDNEKKAIEKYQAAGLKICTMPEEPYDQIVTLLLLLKINAITEGRLEVTSLSLNSDLSDGVSFVYDYETAQNHPFKDGWWTDSGPAMVSTVSNKKDKIVKLVKQSDWSTYDLEWKDKSRESTEIAFIVDNLKT